jgi:hypothetical protein
MSEQGGQAQPPPGTTVGASRSEAIQSLAAHMFGGPPPGGGTFTMDVDQLNDTIKQWNDLLVQLREDEIKAQPMANVQAAGSPLDQAGKNFVDAANASGHAYITANRAQQKFVSNYIEKLTAVRDGHTQADQTAADQLNKKA